MPDMEAPWETEPLIRAESDVVVTPRGEVRDLAALLALPAMWVDHDPAFIVAGLLGVLFGVLRLECGYVRFDDPAGDHALARWRPDGPLPPSALEPLVGGVVTRDRGVQTRWVATPFDSGGLRVTSMAPAFPGEHGLVLVASRRSDFPTERELHLLRIAISQATISIHTARRLARERAARMAAESALRLRNTVLERMAHDLASPLAILSQQASQAHMLATQGDVPPASASSLASVATEAVGATNSESSAFSLTPVIRLSRREAEVLGLLAQGLSNKEIAGLLVLSERTVERHVTGLYRKIGVERRSEATVFALRHNFADTDPYDG